jgi:hypothetical protein
MIIDADSHVEESEAMFDWIDNESGGKERQSERLCRHPLHRRAGPLRIY